MGQLEVIAAVEAEDMRAFQQMRDTLCAQTDRHAAGRLYGGEEALLFVLDGIRIGLCRCGARAPEDDGCVLADFALLPAYRGRGLGARCFAALRAQKAAEGFQYFELTVPTHSAMRFWQTQGFGYNGCDRAGRVRMLLPPQESTFACVPFGLEDLTQLLGLENGYKLEIGELLLTAQQQSALEAAIRAEKLRFFVVKRRTRVVGMCSVACVFSTLSCGESGIFEDFFVEPAFRGKGCARLLVEAAKTWCMENGIHALQVGCGETDVERYRHLGFDAAEGVLLLWSGACE